MLEAERRCDSFFLAQEMILSLLSEKSVTVSALCQARRRRARHRRAMYRPFPVCWDVNLSQGARLLCDIPNSTSDASHCTPRQANRLQFTTQYPTSCFFTVSCLYRFV